MAFDQASTETINAVAPHLQMAPENICNLIIIAVDHSDDHSFVTLSTVPREKLSHFIQSIALLMNETQLT